MAVLHQNATGTLHLNMRIKHDTDDATMFWVMIIIYSDYNRYNIVVILTAVFEDQVRMTHPKCH